MGQKIVWFVLAFFLLFGCVSQKDRVVIREQVFDALIPIQDANVSDDLTINWVGLQNYPAGCPSGYAVQVIDDSLTCVAVGGGGGGGGTDTNTQTAGWTDANGYWTYPLRTDKYTSFRQGFVRVLDTNKLAVGFNYQEGLPYTTISQAVLDLSGSINLRQVANPSTAGMTATPEYDVSYNLTAGTYGYSIKYETADGNTTGSSTGNCVSVTLTSQGRVQLAGIPIPTDTRVKAKYIYRTLKDDYATTCLRGRRLARIPLTQTTYTDNTPEASLPSNDTTFRNDNTTAKGLYVNNVIVLNPGTYNTSYGYSAGARLLGTAYENVFLGYGAGDDINTGTTNVCVGHATCDQIIEGSNNVMLAPFGTYARNTANSVVIGVLATYAKYAAHSVDTIIGRYAYSGNSTGFGSAYNTIVGGFALYNKKAGNYNTIVGARALYGSGAFAESGTGNVYIGYEAGRYLTGNNYNTLIGYRAGGFTDTSIDVNRSVCIGSDCVLKGSNNAIAIGYTARVDLNNAMALGGTGVNAVNVGIGTTTPYYPLVVARDVNGISIWADGNISALGYITRTEVWDKKKGKATNQLKDEKDLRNTDGTINHKAFGESYTKYKTLKVIGYEEEIVEKTECEPTGNPIIYGEEPPQECKTIREKTLKPKLIETEEEGVNIVMEIAMLRQAMYEIKQCILNANQLSEVKTCVE